jgi:hypothetical protein
MAESVDAVLQKVPWAARTTVSYFEDVAQDDGDEVQWIRKRVNVQGICWQPTAAELAPFTVSAADAKSRVAKAELNPARYAWLCAFAAHEKAPPVQATGRHAQNEAFIQGGVNPSYAVREVADGHMLHARHAHELVVQAIQWERDRVTDEMHALRDQNELLRKALKLTPVLHDVDHQAKGRGNKYHRSRLSPALIRKLKPYATLKPSQRTQRLKMIRVACMMLKACSGGMAAPFPALASALALPPRSLTLRSLLLCPLRSLLLCSLLLCSQMLCSPPLCSRRCSARATAVLAPLLAPPLRSPLLCSRHRCARRCRCARTTAALSAALLAALAPPLRLPLRSHRRCSLRCCCARATVVLAPLLCSRRCSPAPLRSRRRRCCARAAAVLAPPLCSLPAPLRSHRCCALRCCCALAPLLCSRAADHAAAVLGPPLLCWHHRCDRAAAVLAPPLCSRRRCSARTVAVLAPLLCSRCCCASAAAALAAAGLTAAACTFS